MWILLSLISIGYNPDFSRVLNNLGLQETYNKNLIYKYSTKDFRMASAKDEFDIDDTLLGIKEKKEGTDIFVLFGEFFAAGVLEILPTFFTLEAPALTDFSETSQDMGGSYLLVSIPLNGITVWSVGTLSGEKGNIMLSLLGSGIGSFIGYILLNQNIIKPVQAGAMILLPPLGATIGYNLGKGSGM